MKSWSATLPHCLIDVGGPQVEPVLLPSVTQAAKPHQVFIFLSLFAWFFIGDLICLNFSFPEQTIVNTQLH